MIRVIVFIFAGCYIACRCHTDLLAFLYVNTYKNRKSAISYFYIVASLSVYNLQMLQWIAELPHKSRGSQGGAHTAQMNASHSSNTLPNYGFRMQTITPSSIKTNDLEPLEVFRRGLPAPALTATRSGEAAGVPTSSAIYTEGVRVAAPLLLRENNREYENTVDTIVQRTREQERIVREWDIEMERLLERQYRMNYDDVVREFTFMVRNYTLYNGNVCPNPKGGVVGEP